MHSDVELGWGCIQMHQDTGLGGTGTGIQDGDVSQCSAAKGENPQFWGNQFFFHPSPFKFVFHLLLS